MDPLLPSLETQERRRRGRLLFRRSKIPLRMLVPNFFTVLSLCAGLTALRMAIEADPRITLHTCTEVRGLSGGEHLEAVRHRGKILSARNRGRQAIRPYTLSPWRWQLD